MIKQYETLAAVSKAPRDEKTGGTSNDGAAFILIVIIAFGIWWRWRYSKRRNLKRQADALEKLAEGRDDDRGAEVAALRKKIEDLSEEVKRLSH